MPKTSLTHVPFDHKGNLLSYTYVTFPDPPVTGYLPNKGVGSWRPADSFVAELVVDRLERGRSAATFIFKDASGHEFPMCGQWLCDALLRGGTRHGRIYGTWGFVKRGATYSIQYEGP